MGVLPVMLHLKKKKINLKKNVLCTQPKLSVQIERMEDCNDPAARGVFQDIVISQQKFNLYTFDCILNISEQINGPLNVSIQKAT